MLVEGLIDYYLKMQRERYERTKDTFATVTELVGCKKKAEFSRRYSNWTQIQPQILVGIITHIGVQNWVKEYYQIEAEFEKTFYKKISIFDGYGIIEGTVDILNKTNNQVIEIKYSRDVYNNTPYEHHINQVRLYLWLTGCDEGKILYITPERIVEFEVNDPMSDNELLSFIHEWKSPRYEWECNYCSYNQFCPHAIKRKQY